MLNNYLQSLWTPRIIIFIIRERKRLCRQNIFALTMQERIPRLNKSLRDKPSFAIEYTLKPMIKKEKKKEKRIKVYCDVANTLREEWKMLANFEQY